MKLYFFYISTCFLRHDAWNIPPAQGQGHQPRSSDLVQTDSDLQDAPILKIGNPN